ncbi:DUF1707 SHOCT-like domain-containing protein [Nocardia shimofusensis]|uniref:DUF1707 SHOCT-like domain-containing protein n=1 Tax=Nocardia shimofusensis TaxID=228596 RepID=UPI00082AB3AD|nr:DUF1707 domain-containing protein [Nocardia shimofusensis]
MEISPSPRASDAERDEVVQLLARHLADGRLDLAEYDARVARVYATTTRDDLDLVLSDLPRPAEDAGRRKPIGDRSRLPLWQRVELRTWAGVSLLVLGIWAAISLGAGEFTYPWPVWVIGPWGAVLAFRIVTGFESGRGCGRGAYIARGQASAR